MGSTVSTISCLISVEVNLMICELQLSAGGGGLSGLLDLLSGRLVVLPGRLADDRAVGGLPGGGGVLGGELFDFRTMTLDQSVDLNEIPISSRLWPIR